MNKQFITILFLGLSSMVMGMEIKKTPVNAGKIKSMCAQIHKKVQQDNFYPELLIGIARGGLVPLAYLAGEQMFNNRNTLTINVASYEGDKQEALKLMRPIHTQDFKDVKSALLIDDLVDSGDTFEFVTQLFKKELPNMTIKTAALFYKERSKIKPDYYVEKTKDWIIFPWENQESSSN